jgi:hypothetical protein
MDEIIAKPSRIKLKSGLTQIQESFCRLSAQFTYEDLPKQAARLYDSIPGVCTDNSPVIICKLLKNEKILNRIEEYRNILNKDKLSLLVERENLTREIIDRWKNDKEQTIKTADMLQALKERELAYGVSGKSAEELNLILENDRMREALSMIEPPKIIKEVKVDVLEGKEIDIEQKGYWKFKEEKNID